MNKFTSFDPDNCLQSFSFSVPNIANSVQSNQTSSQSNSSLAHSSSSAQHNTSSTNQSTLTGNPNNSGSSFNPTPANFTSKSSSDLPAFTSTNPIISAQNTLFFRPQVSSFDRRPPLNSGSVSFDTLPLLPSLLEDIQPQASTSPANATLSTDRLPMLPLPPVGAPYIVDRSSVPRITSNLPSLLPPQLSSQSTPNGPLSSTSSGFLCEGLRSAVDSASSTPNFMNGVSDSISTSGELVSAKSSPISSDSDTDLRMGALYVSRSELSVSIRVFDRFVYQYNIDVEPVGPYNPDIEAHSNNNGQIFSPPASVCSVGMFCACVECHNQRRQFSPANSPSTTTQKQIDNQPIQIEEKKTSSKKKKPSKSKKAKIAGAASRSPYCSKRCQTRQQNLRQKRVSPKMGPISIKRALLARLSTERDPKAILPQCFYEVEQLLKIVGPKGIQHETMIEMIQHVGKPRSREYNIVQEAYQKESFRRGIPIMPTPPVRSMPFVSSNMSVSIPTAQPTTTSLSMNMLPIPGGGANNSSRHSKRRTSTRHGKGAGREDGSDGSTSSLHRVGSFSDLTTVTKARRLSQNKLNPDVSQEIRITESNLPHTNNHRGSLFNPPVPFTSMARISSIPIPQVMPSARNSGNLPLPPVPMTLPQKPSQLGLQSFRNTESPAMGITLELPFMDNSTVEENEDQ